VAQRRQTIRGPPKAFSGVPFAIAWHAVRGKPRADSGSRRVGRTADRSPQGPVGVVAAARDGATRPGRRSVSVADAGAGAGARGSVDLLARDYFAAKSVRKGACSAAAVAGA